MNLPGLLSNWGAWTGDPTKDGAIKQGLLAAGLQMMQSKGKFGQALGQGGMAGLGQFQQLMQQSKADKLRELQMQQAQMQLTQQKSEQDRRATDAGLLRKQFAPLPGPTQDQGALMPRFDPASMLAEGASPEGVQQAMGLHQAMNPQRAPIKLGEGDQLLDPKTFQPLATNAKQEKEHEVVRNMRLLGIDPQSPQGAQMLRSWLQKQTTHAPAASTNVTYGAPVAGIGPDGQPVYFQPGNKPGAPPQIIPGIQPPKVGDDMRKSQAERAAAVQTAADSIAVLDKAINHPGRETATGMSGVLWPSNYLPGTDAKDFRVVADQLQGKAFLQAFDSLKGGGQITEVEGKKATDAIARLNTTQSDGEYKVALEELREVIVKGYERAAGKPYRPKGRSASGAVTPAQGPRPGTVQDGYRFKGGNPADPNAWEPVR